MEGRKERELAEAFVCSERSEKKRRWRRKEKVRESCCVCWQRRWREEERDKGEGDSSESLVDFVWLRIEVGK